MFFRMEKGKGMIANNLQYGTTGSESSLSSNSTPRDISRPSYSKAKDPLQIFTSCDSTPSSLKVETGKNKIDESVSNIHSHHWFAVDGLLHKTYFAFVI
ncbi:hypothetical protein Nepgr_013609 [Nepenthes gracilis]|uniref:Uncharacterized protein n=1 Tax=Nepenthes gracilis TaxID=150966 RepID=A0AAD3SI97_NEPGR|nr:hypothetical protein Nepgr_013609 [Nepenthes gracilis]